ncbi:aminotransferase class III-fold pyridoxal phosphate-dependent enzyme [Nocardia sp. NBC_01377]|uniref:aminotransferase class III-fold pyridoxal phosphate-dependent enzyme n=1 Tax=Nocardia sp. NBC_01377 TaxID=2903595 RepID=UPI0032465EE2
MTRELFDDFARHNRPGLARLLRACHLDVVYAGAEGDHLIGADGTRVLDLVGGFGAALFGHNHPALVRVATARLNQQHPFVSQGSIRAGAARLARRLSDLVGSTTGRDYVVTLGSTGADAVEAARVIDEIEARGPVYVSLANAFHGKSAGAFALTEQADTPARGSTGSRAGGRVSSRACVDAACSRGSKSCRRERNRPAPVCWRSARTSPCCAIAISC